MRAVDFIRTASSYIAVGLVVTICIIGGVCQQSIPSPCPDVFTYERAREENRWYGNIVLHTDIELTGLYIDVVLDRTSDVLGNWFGDVSTADNKQYTITNKDAQLRPNSEKTIRIFVRHSPGAAPTVQTIRFNGRTICSTRKSQTTERYGQTTTYAPPRRRPTVGTVFENAHGTDDNRRYTSSSKPAVNMNSLDNEYSPSTTRRPIHWTSLPPPSPGRGGNSDDDGGFISELSPTTRSTRRPKPTPVRPDVVGCGVIAARPRPLITHGDATNIGQWPWHAALYRSTGIDLKYVCGGSLVSRRHVITAAHCVTLKGSTRVINHDTLMLYLGKYNFRKWTDVGLQNMQVREIIVHPDYNSTNFDSDVAVLKLSTDVEITEYVRPVCLWKDSADLSTVLDREGTVVGWGYDEHGTVTEQLTQAKMPVVAFETCIYSYPDFFSRFTTIRTYCAGFKNGTSVCNGDSGGGMVFPRPNTDPPVWQLRGLVSISVALQNEFICDSNHYVVFADLAKHRDWLDAIVYGQ